VKLHRMIGVDVRNQLLRGLRAVFEAGQHLALSLLPVGQILPELGRSIRHDGPMPRVQDPGLEREQGQERLEVGLQVPFGGIHHARAPPEHDISREHRP